jgi:carboxylesterase type B
MLLYLLLAVSLAFTAVQAAINQGGGLTVHTVQGDVVGSFVSPTVRRFLGIPYAVANRWEAPQSPPLRSSTFNASKFGDSCPQALTLSTQALIGPEGSKIVPESEDCLSVNIWAPSLERKQGTAVMLWIYGGGFQVGTVRTQYTWLSLI